MSTPYEKVVPSFPTPNIEDAIYVELVDNSKAAYTQMDYGVPYPDQAELPGYKFVFQEPVATGGGNDKLVRQVWAKDRFGQDAYNAYTKYVQEGQNYPIFIRSYILPREGYQRLDDLSPLTALVGLTITSGGTGYAGDGYGDIPLIFTGGAGTGATGYGKVENGVITLLKLTNGGSGYTSAPSITAAGGAGFAGLGVLQPASAVLVSEESKIADGHLASLYLSVTRVYHTLPGPTLRQWIWDEQIRIYVKVTKTIVASTDVPSLSAPAPGPGIIIEYQPLDQNRYVQIVSSVVYDSEGQPPAPYSYPTIVEHYPLPNEIVTAPVAPFLYYVWATNTSDHFDMDVGLFLNIREGYSGPYEGRVTEYYTFDPTTITLPSLQVFNPQAASFGVGWWFASDAEARAQIVNFSIPQTLHPEITLGTQGNSGTANVNEIVIPATVPPSIPAAGTYISISFSEPKPYRYGLYIYRKLEIKIPSFA